MWIFWKIGAVILLKRNIAEKDVCRAHADVFLCRHFASLMTPKGKKKKIRLSPNSLNSSYYFFIFSIKGLSFRTQFKIEF